MCSMRARREIWCAWRTHYDCTALAASVIAPNAAGALDWVVLPSRAAQHSVLVRPCGRRRSARNTELHEDVADVAVHGPLAQRKRTRDRLVRLARGDVPQHLELARAQSAQRTC